MQVKSIEWPFYTGFTVYGFEILTCDRLLCTMKHPMLMYEPYGIGHHYIGIQYTKA